MKTSPGLIRDAAEESWQIFAGLMSGTMYRSRAGLRRAGELLTQAGIAVPHYLAALDQSLIADLELRGTISRIMGTDQ